MNKKRVAVIGGLGWGVDDGALMAATEATGSQIDIISDSYDLSTSKTKLKRKKPEPNRIKKKWYTADSPEVKAISK